jgi:tRNA-specific 2-thiouridylase
VRVLVALSGGVDSSVAAACLVDDGHDVVGATMKLWGGPSDSGCCSVADVDDARRVAQQLGIAHHVFNFAAQFERDVVDPYVNAHASGSTPNPCVACNRHLKFDRFVARAKQLGFDAIATGHHARVVQVADGAYELRRGADDAKDQSYVLHMLGQDVLSRLVLPIGELTKAEVREIAQQRGLRTAAKPDSQDVCFISRTGGREAFLGSRIALHPGRIVDADGHQVGAVPAVELVTVGQRRGLAGPTPPPAGSDGVRRRRGLAEADRRYAVEVDVASATVRLGSLDALLVDRLWVADVSWVSEPLASGAAIEVQTSAHGRPTPAVWLGDGRVALSGPIRRVAPGQSAVFYQSDAVVGGGVVARDP